MLRKGRINHMILLEDKVVEEDMEEITSYVGGRHNQGKILDVHCDHDGRNGHDVLTCKIHLENIKDK